jgi:hypothetical protein
VDFIVVNYPRYFKDTLKVVTKQFNYISEKGNPVYTAAQMKTGSTVSALEAVIKHIDQHMAPVSSDDFFQRVITNMVARRLQWFETEVQNSTASIKSMWAKLKHNISNKHPTAITYRPTIDYPTCATIPLDFESTPSFVLNAQLKTDTVVDWASVWQMCVEAYIFEAMPVDEFSVEFMEFLSINSFLFQNALASNNTTLKIRKIVLKSQ